MSNVLENAEVGHNFRLSLSRKRQLKALVLLHVAKNGVDIPLGSNLRNVLEFIGAFSQILLYIVRHVTLELSAVRIVAWP